MTSLFMRASLTSEADLCLQNQGICEGHLETLKNIRNSENESDGEGQSSYTWIPAEVDLERDYEFLFKYKNRALAGRLLHYAVWRSHREVHAGFVDLVLHFGAKLHSAATYTQKSQGVEVKLEAIHIAAGLGHIPSMQRLLSESEQILEEGKGTLLNQYCFKENMRSSHRTDFYCPIHDAVFAGQLEATQWLLENQADPSKMNSNGYTPLHWLAFRGSEHKMGLEDIVKSLISHNARLDTRTSPLGGDKKLQEKLPLEIALTPDSNFPAELTYLLAPSWGLRQGSILEDVSLLANYNRKAAEELATRFAGKSEDREWIIHIVRAARKGKPVESLAHVILTAPLAAARMLEMLMVKPMVQDSGHHPIRKRGRMQGILQVSSMRCAYAPDVDMKSLDGMDADVVWPCWCWDSQRTPAEQLGAELKWHNQLVREPRAGSLRDRVFDIETKALILPDIVDMSIFAALSHIEDRRELGIFDSMPVRGLIDCVWNNLVGRVYFMSVSTCILELLLTAWWGLTPYGGGTDSATQQAPFCWTVIAAGVVRDWTNLSYWLGAHLFQWSKWTRKHRGLKEKKHISGTLVLLWHPNHFFCDVVPILSLMQLLLSSAFLWHVDPTLPEAMSQFQQSLLAIMVMMSFARIFHSLQVICTALLVHLIFLKTFFSGAMAQMTLLAFCLFLAFCTSFAIMSPDDTFRWVFIMLQRSFFFGDGDSFEQTGLSPEEKRSVLAVLMCIGTILFNIVVLNLFIAIYTHCYEHLFENADRLFLQARVQIVTRYLISLQKLPTLRPVLQITLWLLMVVSFALAGSMFLLTPVRSRGNLRILAATLLALGQILCQALCMQSHRLSTMQRCRQRRDLDEQNFEHFLWISYRTDLYETSHLQSITGLVNEATKVSTAQEGFRSRTSSAESFTRTSTTNSGHTSVAARVSTLSSINVRTKPVLHRRLRQVSDSIRVLEEAVSVLTKESKVHESSEQEVNHSEKRMTKISEASEQEDFDLTQIYEASEQEVSDLTDFNTASAPKLMVESL